MACVIFILVLFNIVSGSSVCPSEEALNERVEATETVRESVLDIFSSILNVSSSAENNSTLNLTNMQVYESIATSVNITVTQDGLVKFEEAISEIAASTYGACSAPEESRVQADDTSVLIERFFNFTDAGNISLAREVYGKLLCLQRLLTTESQVRKKRQNHKAELDAFFDMLEGHPDIVTPLFGLTDDQFFGILPTLAFVVDDTGSMSEEISSVKRLIFSFISVERTNPIAYILTTFNDPDVGVAAKYFSNNITQLRELNETVNALDAHDGGDCPEFGMTGILNALALVNPDSNVIVLTDASPKDVLKKQQVIDKANEVRNSIHFFLSREGCGNFTPYIDVANETEGIVVNQISDFEAFAEFADEAGRFKLADDENRFKRQILQNCITFFLSIFSHSVAILFSASSINITVTSPSGVITTVTSAGTIATYNIDTPEAGEYRACSLVEFEYSLTAGTNVDFFVEYTGVNGSRTLLPPAGNTIGVLVTSSRISVISAEANTFLNLVLTDGRVFSNVLTHCGSLLTGMITIPNVTFQFQLEGSDTLGNRFKTNVDVEDVSLIVAPFNVTIHGSIRYQFGDTMELNCTSEGSPELQYSWSRQTSSSNMLPVGTLIKNNTIIIENLTISDGGSYTCTVSNEAGNFSSTTTVIIDGVPYNVTIEGITQYFTGDTLILNCSSHGIHELQYSWNRNTSSGKNIFPTNITNSSSHIIISNVTVDDEGIYTCTVSNEGGNSSNDIFINIIDTQTVVYTEYYLGYFNNFGGTPSIVLINSESHPVLYLIEAPVLGYTGGRVAAESTAVINLPTSVVVTSSSDQRNGIYLKVSSDKMTVVGQDVRTQTTATFLALPNVQLGITQYMYYGLVAADATTRNSAILIVGTENSTMMNLTTTQPVVINVSNSTLNITSGREYSFEINKFQTVYIETFTDLSGTKIATDKPVSVFSGHECVLISGTTAGCDHIVEQIPPTAVWGKVFYISPLLTRRSYTIKTLAAYNHTDISFYCNDTFRSYTINEGESIVRAFTLQEYCAIHSNKNVLVAQFSHGQLDDDAIGDPSMIIVPAKIHYTSKFLVSTIRNPTISGYQHFLNIIVLAQYYHPHIIYIKIGSINQSLDVFPSVPIKVNNITEAYVVRVNVTEGVSEVIHTDPTALMATTMYGFGWYEGYGHAFDLGVPKNFVDPSSVFVTIIALSDQIVGLPLTLQCSVNVENEIDSRIDIIWSSGSLVLKILEGLNATSNTQVYVDTYNITQLNTDDNGRIYKCEVHIVINTIPIVVASNNILIDVIVPTPVLTTLPNDQIIGAIVGSPQDIQCIVSTVSGMELSSVMMSWMGPEGESIANDSRVTISPTTSNGNNYTSNLQFTYLMEGDEGTYFCKLKILNTSNLVTIEINNIVVPAPDKTSVSIIGIQIVGQSLTLECNATTVRGITSRVDIVWSSKGSELKRTEGVHSSSVLNNSVVYTASYEILQLSTSDDYKMYLCEVFVNTSPSIMANSSVTLNVTVPPPILIIIPSGPIQGVIGSSQDIQCIVSTVSGVELSSVMISWMGPEGESIANDSRVTISPTTSSGNNYTSNLQFAYLMEGDEGMYKCNVIILKTNKSNTVEITNLNVPTLAVIVTAPDTQIVGQPLKLNCSSTFTRGITSKVDLVWRSNELELKRIRGINLTLTEDGTSLTYMNTYTIAQLSTSDKDKVYYCELVINSHSTVVINSSIVLNVTISEVSINVTQSLEGIIGLAHKLECTFLVTDGVLPFHVNINWNSNASSLSQSSRIIVSNLTYNGSLYKKTVTFLPLLNRDKGEYTCYAEITGFNETVSSESLIVIAKEPRLTAQLFPPLINGTSYKDPIRLHCSTTVTEGVILASYEFTWMKNDDPINSSSSRYMIVNDYNNRTSSLSIEANNANSIADNGMYSCRLTLFIAGMDNFSSVSNYSVVSLKAVAPPNKVATVGVSTKSHSVNISWTAVLISFDRETYWVQYGTDIPLQYTSDAILGNDDRFATNERFSINITGLTPFTTYYFIVWANNSVGNTSTMIRNFTTDQAVPSVPPSNFKAVNRTSNSITFHWDALVNQANGIIQFYVITCSDKNNVTIMVNISGTSTSITIVGLKPFTNYTCELYATTVSNGPPTDPLTVRTAEQAPTPPVIKHLTAIDSKSVLVEWNRPVEVYGNLSFYTITYVTESGNKKLTIPFDGSETQFHVITGLSPYQQITVTITATNGAGTSEPSNEVSGRTHEAAPGVVEITGVVTISSSASNVTWNPPIEPNGIITGYEVIYSVHGRSTENVIGPLDSDKNSLDIMNLIPGNPYTVIVVAFTSAGRGEENEPYLFFSHELPPEKAPDNVTFARSGSTITVTWKPLSLFEARGFPVYKVTLTPISKRNKRQSNVDGVISVTTNETNVVIEGLDPTVEYSLAVTVGTSSGEVTTPEMFVDEEQSDEGNNNDNDSNNAVLIIVPAIVALILILIITSIIAVVCVIKKQRDKHLYDIPGQGIAIANVHTAGREMEVVHPVHFYAHLEHNIIDDVQ